MIKIWWWSIYIQTIVCISWNKALKRVKLKRGWQKPHRRLRWPEREADLPRWSRSGWWSLSARCASPRSCSRCRRGPYTAWRPSPSALLHQHPPHLTGHTQKHPPSQLDFLHPPNEGNLILLSLQASKKWIKRARFFPNLLTEHILAGKWDNKYEAGCGLTVLNRSVTLCRCFYELQHFTFIWGLSSWVLFERKTASLQQPNTSYKWKLVNYLLCSHMLHSCCVCKENFEDQQNRDNLIKIYKIGIL